MEALNRGIATPWLVIFKLFPIPNPPWQLWKALNREEASCPSRQLQITVVWPSWSNPWQLKSVPKLLESKVTVCRAAIISPHLLTICHYLSSAVLLCLCWLWLATFLGQLHQSEAHTRHTQTDGLHTPHAIENNEYTITQTQKHAIERMIHTNKKKTQKEIHTFKSY